MPPEPSYRFSRRLLIILAVLAVILLGVISMAPPEEFSSRQWARIVQLCVVLGVVALGIARSQRRLSAVAIDLAIWAAIAIVLLAGYSYRFELAGFRDRLLGELIPAQGQVVGQAAVRFQIGDDRQFRVNAIVDGLPVRFIVDTGASGVVLNQADAARLGYDTAALDYTDEYDTANGTTLGAPIHLREIRIGPIRFSDVSASVNRSEMRESLLGMQFLERLSLVEIDGDTLIIRQ